MTSEHTSPRPTGTSFIAEQDSIDLCGRAAGLAGEREAVAFREELLWVEGAAEGLLLATMASRLSGMTELTEDDRGLRDDLLRGLGGWRRVPKVFGARRQSHRMPVRRAGDEQADEDPRPLRWAP